MSRMIPPFYDERITSDGEKKFFKALKNLGDDYFVLHSLGIVEHQEKVFGEIDFVVICKKGILCLEVKGGHVSREEGVWYFTDRHGRETEKTEGPFWQVHSAMQSLRKHLARQFGAGDPISRCQYACGVVFPDMPFTQKGPDIIPEIIFDSRNSLEEIEEYIDRVFAYWRDVLQEKHGFSGDRLGGTNVKKAVSYLRGDFGFVPSMGYIVQRTEENLLALTREQMDRLSIASENRRILLKGGAGTGKTLLSLEYARRSALKGNSVLYLCYNRNLCYHLKSILKNEKEIKKIKIDTFHGYIMDELKRLHSMPSRNCMDEEQFFRTVIPETYFEIMQHSLHERFDTIVIDEGQDLLRYEYIMCLDIMVEDGLQRGNWHICYDPNQSIYNTELDDGLSIINEYNPTLLTLDTNCRNTRPIGVYNTLFTGLEPTRFFRVDGESVVRESYKDFQDERQKLLKAVKKLISQGVSPGDILLLSRYKFEKSCLHGENIFESICKFQNVSRWEPQILLDDSIKFCTIHSFKGLEAAVVFLLDVDGFRGVNNRMLNYTGMSRARSLLYVFYSSSVENELEEMVSNSADLLRIIEE